MENKRTHNEKELVACVANGDSEAFDILFHRYWDHVYSVALIMTKSAAMAEDIGQEVFLALWESRVGLIKIENLKGFLYSHVKFKVHNRLRRTKVEDAYQQYLSVKLTYLQTSSADNRVHMRELQDALQKGMELLPPQQKKAFQLSRQAGMTHEQIGREMNISPKTVKDYIVRAIAFLKKYLGEQGILAAFWAILGLLKK